MSSPRHLRQPCPVIAETPLAAAHFFGFHDVCPWDPTNQCLAVLRVERALRRVPDGTDRAEVCLWDPDSGEMTVQKMAFPEAKVLISAVYFRS